MKVLHLNAGNETGGGMVHILSLLTELTKEKDQYILGLFEKSLFYEKAKSAGIKTVTFQQSSRYDLSILFKIIRFINEEKIDIVHTHGARANLYGYFLRKFTKITWMTTVHSDPRNDFLGRGTVGNIFTKLNLAVLKKPDHYFAISQRFADMLTSFGIERDKISTILNGIDFNKRTNSQLSREDLKLSPNDFVIIMVARFDPVKRHELAIEAFQAFSSMHPDARLLFVGDGPTKHQIEQVVQQKGLENKIVFMGFREDTEAVIRIADVSLLTSKTESFPLVLLESSREKVPVITTDVGGVRDMIPDSSYSFVLPDSKVHTIVDALEKMFKLRQEGKLGVMGDRLRQFTSSHFSVQAFADSVLHVYKMYK
jgi:L-malate glycosyltransferase